MDTRPTTAEDSGDVFVVVRGDNPVHLTAGTRLAEVRRFEVWEHHGCIPSIRIIGAELRVLDGPRSGEVVEVYLECGYEYDPPWPASRQNWLHRDSATVTSAIYRDSCAPIATQPSWEHGAARTPDPS
jgi:hypothetical protein